MQRPRDQEASTYSRNRLAARDWQQNIVKSGEIHKLLIQFKLLLLLSFALISFLLPCMQRKTLDFFIDLCFTPKREWANCEHRIAKLAHVVIFRGMMSSRTEYRFMFMSRRARVYPFSVEKGLAGSYSPTRKHTWTVQYYAGKERAQVPDGPR